MTEPHMQPVDASDRHPSVQAVTKYFSYSHLNSELAEISKLYVGLANKLLDLVSQDSPELTVAYRKLLESKDAAVRAKLDELADR